MQQELPVPTSMIMASVEPTALIFLLIVNSDVIASTAPDLESKMPMNDSVSPSTSAGVEVPTKIPAKSIPPNDAMTLIDAVTPTDHITPTAM